MNRFSTNLPRSILPVVLFAALVPPALAAGPPDPVPLPPMILTAAEAIGPLPPELIAAPTVLHVMPSPDGRYVLTLRRSLALTPTLLHQLVAMQEQPTESHQPGAEAQPSEGQPAQAQPAQAPLPSAALILEDWDARTHRSRVVWTGTEGADEVAQVAWLPRTHTALMMIVQPAIAVTDEEPGSVREGVYRILAASGRAEPIGFAEPSTADREDTLQLTVSPSRPFALLDRVVRKVSPAQPGAGGTSAGVFSKIETIYPVAADGTLGAGISRPLALSDDQIFWTADGSPLLEEQQSQGDAKQPPPDTWFSLDPKTSRVTVIEGPAPHGLQPGAIEGFPNTARTGFNDLRLTGARSLVTNGGAAVPVMSLWLETAPPAYDPSTRPPQPQRVLLNSNASDGQFLADGSAVLYTSQGAAWAVPLLRLNRALFEKAQQAARRTVALSNAKQLGLGLLIYAQDYDELLPTPDGIQDKLRPYLKNDSLFNDFNYTYGGGKLSDINDPASTRLGTVSGPGGNAVIFADGHVKWEGN